MCRVKRPLTAVLDLKEELVSALRELQESKRSSSVRSRAEIASRWCAIATLLRDALGEIANPEVEEGTLHIAKGTCDAVLEELRKCAPDLFAVAKYSTKRNGPMSQKRSIERGLTEVVLLVGAYVSLDEGYERQALLDAVRPIAQTRSNTERVRSMLILIHGFYTPGFGKRSGTWRKGQNTVHEVLSASYYRSSAGQFKELLGNSPGEMQQYSKALRAALAMMEPALHLWLQRVGPDIVIMPSGVNHLWFAKTGSRLEPSQGAVALLLLLVQECGEEGVRAAQSIARWVIDRLLDKRSSLKTFASHHHNSEVASLLLATHNLFVLGKSVSRRIWLEDVDRVGQGIWLMLLGVSEAVEWNKRLVPGESITQQSLAKERILARVQSIMLAFTIAEHCERLRPELRDAMARMHVPTKLLSGFLLPALNLEIESDGTTLDHAMTTKLLSWSRPELIFNYFQMHAGSEEIESLFQRWVLALLGAGKEDLHSLRFSDTHNAAHFKRLASSSHNAKQVVDVWMKSDYMPGTQDPETMFMMGEELQTCMRIDKECVASNRALLGYLCQGNVRMLMIDEKNAFVGGEAKRIVARTIVRLLGRFDTASPILFVDRPLHSPHIMKGNAAEDASRCERLNVALKKQAFEMAAHLNIPVAMWDDCVAPSTKFPISSQGFVALVEFDGVAPCVYNNLIGELERGKYPMSDPSVDLSRLVVHALMKAPQTILKNP